MQVRCSNHLSSPQPVRSGVPQGSVLGPVLFLLYINHVVSDIKCNFKIFADDVKLYLSFPVGSSGEGIAALQSNIDTLVSTSASWNLFINPEKCVVLRFSPRMSPLQSSGLSPYTADGVQLQFSESHSDLGVQVDRKLKFHGHIRRRVAVAGALTTNILSSTLCREADFLLSIYISHVRPQLEYGSQLWNQGYIGDTTLVERIQRRWTREMDGIGHLPYDERLRALDLYSVRGRLLRADLLLVWKMFHGECALNPREFFEPTLSTITRGHSLKMRVQQCRLDVRKRFFSNRVVAAWNSLSAEAVEAGTINSFKSHLHRELGDQLYQFF